MAVRKKTDQTDPFCRVVTVTVLPVHLQAKHILFSDQVCFLAAPDLYFAFQHRNVCSCLFPLTAAGIFCPRFHINPVNLCHTVIFIRKTVPYFIFAPYFLCRLHFFYMHQSGPWRHILYQLLKFNVKSADNLSDHTKRRVCNPFFDLSQHTFAHSGLFSHSLKTHPFFPADPL